MTTKADHKAALEWAKFMTGGDNYYGSEALDLAAAYLELRELATAILPYCADQCIEKEALRAALGEE